jgi:hypothetical protein
MALLRKEHPSNRLGTMSRGVNTLPGLSLSKGNSKKSQILQ